MRGLTHRWQFAECAEKAQPAEAGRGEEALARALGVEPLVARVLIARGKGNPDDARAFCTPALMDLSDPTLVPGLETAAERLHDALMGGEHITIYGDYDVDGVTATAILHHVMRAIAPDARIDSYVPHRLDEGYGINNDAVRELAARGVKVIVSVDCGITAIEPARVARELGVELIITDHHNARADGILPDAFAIVHPRIGEGCAHDEDAWAHLSGAGVAFALAWRVAALAAGGGRVGQEMQMLLLDLLALAALGTVADVVPLQGDNRIITKYGLARIRSTALIGLGALVAESGLVDADIDAEHAGFQLGPRLNACGRMWHAAEAIELFITQDVERARAIAMRLGELNRERQRLERGIVDAACKEAEARGMTGDDGARAIVLAHPDWHRGIVGIACSRLVSRFGRPAMLLQEDGGLCSGSGRSIDGFNLHAALHACSEHLETYGGHDMAAGLALRSDQLDGFVQAMQAHAAVRITDEMLTPSLRIDCKSTLDELTVEGVRQLNSLGPFGRSNPKPRLLVRGARLASPRLMGAHAKHVSFDISQGRGRPMRIVAWNWGGHFEQVRSNIGAAVDLVLTPQLNSFRGVTKVEGTLADCSFAGAPAAC